MPREKTKQVCFRLTNDEYDLLKSKFDASGYKTMTKFLHDTLCDSKKKYKRYTDIAIYMALYNAVRELNAIGNNINQSAYVLNLKACDIVSKSFLLAELRQLRENQIKANQLAEYIKGIADKIEADYNDSKDK